MTATCAAVGGYCKQAQFYLYKHRKACHLDQQFPEGLARLWQHLGRGSRCVPLSSPVVCDSMICRQRVLTRISTQPSSINSVACNHFAALCRLRPAAAVLLCHATATLFVQTDIRMMTGSNFEFIQTPGALHTAGQGRRLAAILSIMYCVHFTLHLAETAVCTHRGWEPWFVGQAPTAHFKNALRTL